MTSPSRARRAMPFAPWVLAAAIVATSVACADHHSPAAPITSPATAPADAMYLPEGELSRYDDGRGEDDPLDDTAQCLADQGYTGRSDGSDRVFYAPWWVIEWCAGPGTLGPAPGDTTLLLGLPPGAVVAI